MDAKAIGIAPAQHEANLRCTAAGVHLAAANALEKEMDLEREFSASFDEIQAEAGRSLSDDRYKRRVIAFIAKRELANAQVNPWAREMARLTKLPKPLSRTASPQPPRSM